MHKFTQSKKKATAEFLFRRRQNPVPLYIHHVFGDQNQTCKFTINSELFTKILHLLLIIEYDGLPQLTQGYPVSGKNLKTKSYSKTYYDKLRDLDKRIEPIAKGK